PRPRIQLLRAFHPHAGNRALCRYCQTRRESHQLQKPSHRVVPKRKTQLPLRCIRRQRKRSTTALRSETQHRRKSRCQSTGNIEEKSRRKSLTSCLLRIPRTDFTEVISSLHRFRRKILFKISRLRVHSLEDALSLRLFFWKVWPYIS